MYTMVCKTCGKEFTNKYTIHKYCSKNCFYESKKGVKRPEFAKKISKIMLDKHMVYKDTERTKKISNSHKGVQLTEKQMGIILKGIDKYYYVSNVIILLNHINMLHEIRNGLIYKVTHIMKKIRESEEFQKKHYFVTEGHLSTLTQKLSDSTIKSIVKDSKILHWDVLLQKYNITKVQYISLLEKHHIKKYKHKKINKGRTKIESTILDMLEILNIPYLEQDGLLTNYRYDFVIYNKYVIEVQGDYWHANPRIYNLQDLNQTQKNNIERDQKKKVYLMENGYTLIIIWEMDIYRKRQTIVDFLTKLKRGNLHDREKYFSSEFF